MLVNGGLRGSRAGGDQMGLKAGIMGGGGKLTWNRFTGPGRLAIQTMFIAPLEGEGVASHQPGDLVRRA
jgi:uncharacterized protein (AIM24 family)